MDLLPENNIPAGLVMGIIPIDYPNTTFTLHAIEQLENIARTVFNCNFQSSTLQKGIWRAEFQDEESKVLFWEAMMQLQPQFDPFVILPFRDVPEIRFEARIPGRNLTDYKIFSKINKDNEGIDTSHWHILETVQEAEEMLVEFQIDAESFHFIQERNGI